MAEEIVIREKSNEKIFTLEIDLQELKDRYKQLEAQIQDLMRESKDSVLSLLINSFASGNTWFMETSGNNKIYQVDFINAKSMEVDVYGLVIKGEKYSVTENNDVFSVASKTCYDKVQRLDISYSRGKFDRIYPISLKDYSSVENILKKKDIFNETEEDEIKESERLKEIIYRVVYDECKDFWNEKLLDEVTKLMEVDAEIGEKRNNIYWARVLEKKPVGQYVMRILFPPTFENRNMAFEIGKCTKATENKLELEGGITVFLSEDKTIYCVTKANKISSIKQLSKDEEEIEQLVNSVQIISEDRYNEIRSKIEDAINGKKVKLEV